MRPKVVSTRTHQLSAAPPRPSGRRRPIAHRRASTVVEVLVAIMMSRSTCKTLWSLSAAEQLQ